MSSRKYRSLCLNGQHSGPAGRGGERFFLPVPRAGERPGRKGPVPLRAGVPGTGMVPLRRHVPAPSGNSCPVWPATDSRRPAAVRPGDGSRRLSRRCGSDVENRFDFSVLRRPMPRRAADRGMHGQSIAG